MTGGVLLQDHQRHGEFWVGRDREVDLGDAEGVGDFLCSAGEVDRRVAVAVAADLDVVE